MEKSLYQGQVVLKFSPGNHCYYANGKICQGVTSGLKELYPQDDLLEWYSSMAANDIVLAVAGAEHEQWLKDAFLDVYKGSEPVIPPNVRCNPSFDGKRLVELYMQGKAAPTKRSQYGKDVGTIVHEMVDQYHKYGIDGVVAPAIEHEDTANKSFNSYVKWFEQSGLSVVESERMVYSYSNNYAGTLDRIYRTSNGKYIMGDFKTSNISRKSPLGVRDSYWSQLGAYIQAYQEEMNIQFSDAIIVNSPKNGALKVAYASDMGLTPNDLALIFLDDLKALRNHKFLRNQLRKLKSKI